LPTHTNASSTRSSSGSASCSAARSRTRGDVHAGYLLRCDSVEAAEALAAEDPYFCAGVFRPEAVEWELVGIDPRAID